MNKLNCSPGPVPVLQESPSDPVFQKHTWEQRAQNIKFITWVIIAIFSLLLCLRYNFFTHISFSFSSSSWLIKTIPLSLPFPHRMSSTLSLLHLNSLPSLTVILTTHLSLSRLFMSEKVSPMQFLYLNQFLSDCLIWNDLFFLLQLIFSYQ